MKIHGPNSTQDAAGIAASIATDVRSWHGWTALHIEVPGMDAEAFENAARSAQAVLGSCLKEVEGSAYFCNGQDLYVLCKHLPERTLEQIGAQICDLVFVDNELAACCESYDLGVRGIQFAEAVFSGTGEGWPPKLSIDSGEESLERPEEEALFSIEARQGPAKVLLVEDDAVTRWMVRNSLKDECEFATAQSAGNAFSMYVSFKPDLVLLDIGLPDNNGSEVLDWIMRNDPGACVVMLSGKDNVDNISGCLEKGAKGFIPKPFVRDDLLHYIRGCGTVA
ncbi:MAG: response regulator [Alphaproteobacteria bacterium]|nr:response regulator [Alphaproteobacteria bacterium]